MARKTRKCGTIRSAPASPSPPERIALLWSRWISSALMPPALLTSQLIDLKLEDKRACSFAGPLLKTPDNRAGPVPRQAAMPAMLCDTGGASCHSSFTRDFLPSPRCSCDLRVLCGVPSGPLLRRCALRGKYLCFSDVGHHARGRRLTA